VRVVVVRVMELEVVEVVVVVVVGLLFLKPPPLHPSLLLGHAVALGWRGQSIAVPGGSNTSSEVQDDTFRPVNLAEDPLAGGAGHAVMGADGWNAQ